MSYDPQKIYEKLIESGNDWADKKSAFMQLDDFTKSVLAGCISDVPKIDPETKKYRSMADKTELARSDDIYLNHMNTLAEARRAWLFSEVRYKSAQALADGRRTEASTRRAEANYNGLQK